MYMYNNMAESRERIRGPSRDGREGFTSPRQVLRRLMLLSEGRQFREAAGVVGRLGPSVLRSVVAELPMDILIDALPHSAYLLESFFTRLNTIITMPKPEVPVEPIMWNLVKLFGNAHESGLKQRCTKLAQAIAVWQPELRQSLKSKRTSIDSAVQSLGVHGLTADSSGNLISLHVALKTELQRHIETYKMALHKLEELSSVTVTQDPAQSSHQRLLAISHSDIQQRLIDNKTLLTILEKPALKQLPQLIENLQQRVQNDKEVLFNVGEIKRIDPSLNIEERPAAGLLMNFSRGCDAVLGLIGQSAKPESPTENSSSSDGYHSDSADSFPDDVSAELINMYAHLYSSNRTTTLEALDGYPQLKNLYPLKAKILFSIIVLAFRASHTLRERKLAEIRRTLFCEENGDETTYNLDRAIRKHLMDTSNVYPLFDMERQVANQVLSTLHEYPCLESCIPLVHYIKASVRVAWKMANQNTPYYLDNDYGLGLIKPEKHERHPLSDRRSDIIKAFVWPALIQNNRCIVKAIVTT